MIKKGKLNNLEIYAFPNRKVFLNYLSDKQKILIAINAEKILTEDNNLHKIVNQNIGYADGAGAVMALKQKGFNAVKIPGAEFWLDIIEENNREKTFYLIGASQDVIEKTKEKLEIEYPGIRILGYRNGFLKSGEKEKLIQDLISKKPEIIFVAQGSPRQEFLMDELIKIHPALYMGLGGSFDVYCGLKKRAPQLFLKTNLEWFYRLLKEPTRFKRQLVLLKFFILLKLKKL